MSTPQNPLNYYRSYSYHHILVVCDGTATAEELSLENDLTKFDHSDQYGNEQRFMVQRNSVGGYVVLINGLGDAQLSIKSAKWSSVLIPSGGKVKGMSQVQTMATEGELIIQEPNGINFMNVLNTAGKELGKDPTGLCFLLKTIFVGIRDDGKEEIIPNVKALMMLMLDITASFDVTGAEYSIIFVGIVNGAARLPHPTAIANNFNFTIDKTSLSENIERLQQSITDYYKTKRNDLEAQSRRCGVTIDWSQFIDVTYKITLDPEYKKAEYVASSNNTHLNTAATGKSTTTTGTSKSFDMLLTDIMLSCDKVVKDQKANLPEKYTFKITSNIETTADTFLVHYQIQRFKGFAIKSEELETWSPPSDSFGNPQGLTLDYIFTGKNVDIISFDLKMQYGLMFFQVLSTHNTIPSSTNELLSYYNPELFIHGTGNTDGPGDGKQIQGVIKRKPLFLGTTIKDPMFRNHRSVGGTESFNSALTRQAAIENLEARVVIRGNPQLLEELTLSPKDIVENVDPAVITPPSSINAGLRSVMSQPHKVQSYVKVNVFMPNEWSATRQNTIEDADYAQNFWYKGWYSLYQVENNFDNGEFTQELLMFSMPTDDSQAELGKCDSTPSTGAAPVSKTAADTTTNKTSTNTQVVQPQAAPVLKSSVEGTSIQDMAAKRAAAGARVQKITNTTPTK